MSFFRRLFDSRARQALEAEAEGELQKAAYLWVEMGQAEKAAELMVQLGERSSALDEKVRAWSDALRFLPEGEREARRDLEGRIGVAVLAAARAEGANSAESKRRLADAAARLERAERWVEAADCFELLGRSDDLARCLERAGEIERLERVLSAGAEKEQKARRLRRLITEQEMAARVGARHEARKALREALALAPADPSIAALLRRLEEKWPRRRRLRLEVGGSRVGIVGSLPAVIGRADADLSVRGASVSRRHAEIDRKGSALVVRDLGSRNGTLVAGVPIAGEIALHGALEVGLGDDVSIRVIPAQAGVVVEVLRGLDRGETIVVGVRGLRVPGVAASVEFVDDRAVMTPDPGIVAVLGTQTVAAAIDLLIGDVITIGGTRIEVLA